MAFQVNMTEVGSGGGFYGDGRVCTWNNWRSEAHGLVKHGPDGVTVVEEYPPQCMVGVDLYADRTELDDEKFPEFVTQWYGVGQLPLAVLEALGWPLARLQTSILAGPGGQDQWKRRLQQPGGFQPSVDGRSPSTTPGAFFGADPPEKIYSGSGWAVLKGELENLANSGGEDILDRLSAHGLAALNGLRAVAGQKQMPKSKAVLKKEEAAAKMGVKADVKEPRSIMVPVEIVKWPWKDAPEAGASVGTAAAAPVPAPVATKPAAAPAPAAGAAPAAAAAAAPATPTPATDDAKIAEAIIGILGKSPDGSIIRSAQTLGVPFMQKFNGQKNIGALVKRAASDDFLGGEYNGLLWNFDQAVGTGKISLLADTTAAAALEMLAALGG